MPTTQKCWLQCGIGFKKERFRAVIQTFFAVFDDYFNSAKIIP